jgi:hypothetical protein
MRFTRPARLNKQQREHLPARSFRYHRNNQEPIIEDKVVNLTDPAL